MKMNTNMRMVIRMKSKNDLCITSVTIAIDLSALRMRVTLSTRKVRNTLTVLKACRLPAPEPPPSYCITISTIDKITTPPSSKFMGS